MDFRFSAEEEGKRRHARELHEFLKRGREDENMYGILADFLLWTKYTKFSRYEEGGREKGGEW
jgi:hypothetical protein